MSTGRRVKKFEGHGNVGDFELAGALVDKIGAFFGVSAPEVDDVLHGCRACCNFVTWK